MVETVTEGTAAINGVGRGTISDDDQKGISWYQPPRGALVICYEDKDLLILDKPAGLLTVPGKDPAHKDCLESRAQRASPEARIVHRLDMATSGLVILAKNKAAHRHLGLQFERRQIEKRYDALIAGRPTDEEGTVDLPLMCDWPNRPLQKIDYDAGKKAVTTWRLGKQHFGAHYFDFRQENQKETAEKQQKSGTAWTVWHIALFPLTGRSHQLRVHMNALGCPIVGDCFYAPMDKEPHRSAPRMMLHASRLCFRHPDGGRKMDIASQPPFIARICGT